MSNKTTSYAPPTISLYAGPGTLANTVGGEGVNVTGISEAPRLRSRFCAAAHTDPRTNNRHFARNTQQRPHP